MTETQGFRFFIHSENVTLFLHTLKRELGAINARSNQPRLPAVGTARQRPQIDRASGATSWAIEEQT
jgi:hypothetical protein